MITTKNEINRIKLYLKALECLGLDNTPEDKVSDMYDCADHITTIIKMMKPNFVGSASTTELKNILDKHPDFERVATYQGKSPFIAGNIVLCATGEGSKKNANGQPVISNGHVGVIGENEEIMSNDSYTGKWTTNYTVSSWVNRWRNQGGYPIYVYRLK